MSDGMSAPDLSGIQLLNFSGCCLKYVAKSFPLKYSYRLSSTTPSLHSTACFALKLSVSTRRCPSGCSTASQSANMPVQGARLKLTWVLISPSHLRYTLHAGNGQWIRPSGTLAISSWSGMAEQPSREMEQGTDDALPPAPNGRSRWRSV